jgi:hypothetical protein
MGRVMPYQRSEIDRRNDKRLLTPLLLMAVIVVAGIVIYSYTGHAFAITGGMIG